MNFIERWNQRFGFTKNEQLVILFLVTAFLFGGSIKLFFKNSQFADEPQYDYSEMTKEFDELSRAFNDSLSYSESVDKRANETINVSQNAQVRLTDEKKNSKIININTATTSELEQLPGIGPSVAKNIIAYRNEHKLFHSLEEIKNIKGIGEKKFTAIKKFLSLD
ncbi:MAG: helix-hairpin-helix domain-containing protein [Ignavibacteria bacterium]|nr:helix-hairpin-helix domain-containing protein [Ignavibacteria bacterium]